MSIKNGIEEWDDLRRGQILRNSSFVSIINYFHKFSAKKKISSFTQWAKNERK